LVTTASTVIVGHLGERELAAVGLAISLANVSGYTVLVGLSSTLQTTAGQAFGAKNFEEVSLSLQRCLILCSIVLGAVGALWLNSKWLLVTTGQEEAIACLAATYLKYLFPGLCCYMVTICLENWLAAQRVTKMQGTGGVILLAGFVPLCWFLVHPMALGTDGAAIATSLGHLFLMLWMVGQTLLATRSSLTMSWQGLSRRAFTSWYPFLRLAVPSLFVISKRWATEIIVLLSGTLPDPEANLAAMTIFANTCAILSMPPLSLGCAGNTRVSNELGAGCPWAAHFAAKVNYSLGLCLASFLSAVMLTGRCFWLHLITREKEVLDHTKHILVICPLYVAFDCMCTVTNGALKGCG
ncbi:DTX16, partial [Symbiodinium pilosum]